MPRYRLHEAREVVRAWSERHAIPQGFPGAGQPLVYKACAPQELIAENARVLARNARD